MTWTAHRRLIIFSLLLVFGGFCFWQGYVLGLWQGTWRGVEQSDVRSR